MYYAFNYYILVFRARHECPWPDRSLKCQVKPKSGITMNLEIMSSLLLSRIE